jgi:hypothetical protein
MKKKKPKDFPIGDILNANAKDWSLLLQSTGQQAGYVASNFLRGKIRGILKEWKSQNPHNTVYCESGLMLFWKSFLEVVTKEVFDKTNSMVKFKVLSEYNPKNMICLGFKTSRFERN